jgi:hypothetical protein
MVWDSKPWALPTAIKFHAFGVKTDEEGGRQKAEIRSQTSDLRE